MDQGKAIILRATYTVSGVVQGVGFRPFVARLAQECGLTGQVQNEGGQVRIIAYGSKRALDAFANELKRRAPKESRILSFSKCLAPLPVGEMAPVGFVIAQSVNAQGLVAPTPDIAVCDDCLREMQTASDPRYRNPFISCTHCGPRYTILHRLPYDRQNTAMEGFSLCETCIAQYANPADRRCHAQTVCCNRCGPTLRWLGQNGSGAVNSIGAAGALSTVDATGEAALENAIRVLQIGGIIAVKGIGGYHLACDATQASAVAALRTLKGREGKPFAVMFASLGILQMHCFANGHERALLQSPQRPIVLLRRRKASVIAQEVYGSSPNLGAFLPYTPLQALLLAKTAPLVMTSANPSGLPILKDDAQALDFAAENPLCGGVLYHDRAIVRRVDDSVAMVVSGQPLLLRRARGYVPLPLPFAGANSAAVLALGAQQKSTVCLSAGEQMYLSTEIGDLNSLETMAVYRETIRDMQALFGIVPQTMVCDLHPGYDSTRFAMETGLPVLPVQHHFAHIASVLAEAGRQSPVIGVAFDGTGYGPDGTVWGGEFLIASATGYTRAAHIEALRYLGGDASVLQGWKSAASLLNGAGLLRAQADPRYPAVQSALHAGVNTIRSSSMGRVFDGVSSLIGICHESSYEGQCAIELENAATRAAKDVRAETFPFDIRTDTEGVLIISLAPCIRALVLRRDAGECKEILALCFHVTVCRIITETCIRLRDQYGLGTVALSGGVFQNRLLLAQTLCALANAGFETLINRAVPPNDGGISLGQAYIAHCIQTDGGGVSPCV